MPVDKSNPETIMSTDKQPCPLTNQIHRQLWPLTNSHARWESCPETIMSTKTSHARWQSCLVTSMPTDSHAFWQPRSDVMSIAKQSCPQRIISRNHYVKWQAAISTVSHVYRQVHLFTKQPCPLTIIMSTSDHAHGQSYSVTTESISSHVHWQSHPQLIMSTDNHIQRQLDPIEAVSYTHLTLPTKIGV